MAIEKKIKVEVAYATREHQKILTVEMLNGSTIKQAIQISGILELFPEIDLMSIKVGIFSIQKQLSDIVNEGERIEIYRPLLIDPKEARRKREKNK